jgi:hypothetical protein
VTNAERIAKNAKIGRRLLVGVVAAVCALSLYTFSVNVQQGDDITNVHNEVTRIQKTPCGQHPADPSRRCEHLRQELAASESIVAGCIAHQRVEGTKGRNCPRFYVDVRSPGTSESVVGASPGPPTTTGRSAGKAPGGVTVPSEGGAGNGAGAQQPSSAGARPPSPSHPPAPSDNSDGPPPPNTPGNSDGSGNSESSKANPVAEGAGKAVEDVGAAAGDVVKEAGETVNGAVEGVTGKACGLVGANC